MEYANDLPPRMHFKHGAYWYIRNNKWTRLHSDREAAMAAYVVFNEQGIPDTVKARTKYYGDAYTRAKKNSKKRRIDFMLTMDDFRRLVARSGGACEVTRIAFDLRFHGSKKRRPFGPSLDRIDSSGPYSYENCRLVCIAANMALGEWGDDVFRRVAKGFLRKPRRVKTPAPEGAV